MSGTSGQSDDGPEPHTIRIMVVDDHRTVADAVALAIGSQPGLECVGTAQNARDAVALAQRLVPDAIVMDVRLGDGDDGIDATAAITATMPEVRVIVLTAHVDHALLQRAADAGACALLPKDGSLASVLDALRMSTRNGFVVHPALLRSLVRTGPAATTTPTLTPREQAVLSRLAQGMDAGGISRDLGISVLTCRGYVKTLLAKLNAHTQLEAVVNAQRLGLVPRRDQDQ